MSMKEEMNIQTTTVSAEILGGEGGCIPSVILHNEVGYKSIETMVSIAAPLASLVGVTLERTWHAYKEAKEVKEERKQNLSRLFQGIVENSQVLVPIRPNEGGECEEIVHTDIETIGDLFKGLKGISRYEPRFKELSDILVKNEKGGVSPKPDFSPKEIHPQMNHVYIGLCNPFVRWLFHLENEEQVQPIPIAYLKKPKFESPYYYVFHKRKEVKERGKGWGIFKKDKGGNFVGLPYMPEFAPGLNRYPRDYLMILRIPSLFNASEGNMDFVIAGIHRHGTRGIGKLLDDDAIITEIVQRIGSSMYYQIVLEVHNKVLEENEYFTRIGAVWRRLKFYPKYEDHEYRPTLEPDKVKLIDVIPLDMGE